MDNDKNLEHRPAPQNGGHHPPVPRPQQDAEQHPAQKPPVVPQNTAPQSAVPHPAVPHPAMPHNAVPHNAVPQNTVPQNTVPQNVGPRPAVPQNPAQQNAAPQSAAPQTPTPRPAGAPREAAHMAAPGSVNLPMRKKEGFHPDKRLVAGGVVVMVLIVGFCVWWFGLRGYFAAQEADPVYVAPVSSITGVMSASDPRYSGLVEPQKVTKVNKDESRTVDEVLVVEGDSVTVGQALFSYDTGETDLAIRQAELELEGIANQITVLQENKTQLEKQLKEASKDDEFKYTTEIQSVALQIKSQEHERAVKQTELDKLRASLENNQVLSEVDGTVQQINLTPATDAQGNQLPFMSILSSGEFRIKGTVTEMNINSIAEGQSVTVVSRVDPSQSWPGTVESIDYEPVQDNNNMYYYGGDSGEKASKYNFYVTLSSLEGLILGQHVYIEPDTGSSARTGLWLPEMYVVPEGDGKGYVWARDEDEKLEMRPVSLGQHDEGEGLYEILSGLAASDYIAIPAEGLVVGGPTTTDASSAANPGGEPGMDQPAVDPGIDPGVEGGVDPGIEGGTDDNTVIPEGEDTLPDDGGIMPRDGTEGGEDVGGEAEG